MRKEVDAAIQRYLAMAGRLQGPEKVERQGERDRERFGDKYLAFDEDGNVAWHPLPTIRFLVEVCGIPFQESQEAVMEDAYATGVGAGFEPVTPPEEQARKLFAKFGNVVETIDYAEFLMQYFAGNNERGALYWRDVLLCAESIAFVPENTGWNNWL